MADITYWENILISEFVEKRKRDRYTALLKGPKKRKQFLDLLNHSFEYDVSKATSITGSDKSPKELMKRLLKLHVQNTCYLIADQNDKDHQEIRLEWAINEMLDNYWGAIIICPPKPIIVYKSEETDELILLQKNC